MVRERFRSRAQIGFDSGDRLAGSAQRSLPFRSSLEYLVG